MPVSDGVSEQAAKVAERGGQNEEHISIYRRYPSMIGNTHMCWGLKGVCDDNDEFDLKTRSRLVFGCPRRCPRKGLHLMNSSRASFF